MQSILNIFCHYYSSSYINIVRYILTGYSFKPSFWFKLVVSR
nr:MAG TPA: hypothetical protein [Caudoviricetes sp.]